MFITNDIIIRELLSIYSLEEIIEGTGLSRPTINAILQSFDFDSPLTKVKFMGFWDAHVRKHSKQIPIEEFVSGVKSGKTYLVDTPDGFTTISKLFEKNPRHIVNVNTKSHKLQCSGDHLVETPNGWVHAKDANGLPVLTSTGVEVAVVEHLDRTEPVWDFQIDHENHRYWGGTGISSHNSGKSFLTCNAIKHAQLAGFHVLALDSENALDMDYLTKIGAKVDEENLTYAKVTTIEDVNSICSEFFKSYTKAYGKDNPDSPKVLIILDSLAMLASTTEMENYEGGGVIKGDQGQLAKRRKAMLKLIHGQLAMLPMALVFTDHVYNQDIMLGDGAWAITNSVKFFPSAIGLVTKLKLKEGTEVVGVRMRVETYKSRFAKAGTKIELEVPYSSGMSPFTGLCGMLEALGVITKSTVPGKKQGWMMSTEEIDGEVYFFKPADMTHEDAAKLFKHPKAKPITSSTELPDLHVVDEDE